MRRRSLLVIITTLLAVLIVFVVSGRISAPEPEASSVYKEGDLVSLKGELTCLPHRDQSGPQTLECAYGFKDEAGAYYALRDTDPGQSVVGGAPFNTPVQIEGVYRATGDDTYQQIGTIEVKTIIE